MDKKTPFGATSAEEFEIGDIVEWSKWDPEVEDWVSNFGILVSVENKVVSDRVISVSSVKPLNEKDNKLIELFTIYLKPVLSNKKND